LAAFDLRINPRTRDKIMITGPTVAMRFEELGKLFMEVRQHWAADIRGDGWRCGEQLETQSNIFKMNEVRANYRDALYNCTMTARRAAMEIVAGTRAGT
jgi:hypothetical protein